MSTLLVGYDKRQGEDYSPIENALKQYGAWWHNLDSTWLINTPMTVVQLRDSLTPYMNQADKLLVLDVTGDAAAWRGFDAEASDWLKKYL